ncbi:thiamine phosphate synthase [Rhodovibrio salinarum]|uniref:Thiamine phosphate synthase n=1 Tax=Rhodovibrio salinarum TaxID=1087 RepID=A0A934QIG5_9PROT|nr:thiamine phosphate synthase [Rhodovibrio salinarum]MBK1697307.1 thiamine phosphate synthase [Rhodovibrio salinarum]
MTDDPQDPLARLYLIVPAGTTADTLAAALDGGDVAAVLLPPEAPASLIETAQARDVAALLADDPSAVKRLDADGVHLGPGGKVKAARKSLGEDRIVGMFCATSRHAAMMAGEAGADYVAFTAPEPDRGPPETAHDAEHTGNFTWWQAVMELPCVAMAERAGPPITLDDVTPLVSAGADFVALAAAVWQHPDGPAAAVAEANARIARAAR